MALRYYQVVGNRADEEYPNGRVARYSEERFAPVAPRNEPNRLRVAANNDLCVLLCPNKMRTGCHWRPVRVLLGVG